MLSLKTSSYLNNQFDLENDGIKRPNNNFILVSAEILEYILSAYSPASAVMYLFTQWNLNKWGMSGDFANYDVRRFIRKIYSKETIRQSFRLLGRAGVIAYRYDKIRRLGRHVFKLKRIFSAFGEIKKIPPKERSYLRNNTDTISDGVFLENNQGKSKIHTPNSPPERKKLDAFERNVSYTLKRLNLYYLDPVLFAKFLKWQEKKFKNIKSIMGVFIANYKAEKLKYNQPNMLEKYADYVEKQIDYYARYKWPEMKEQFSNQANLLSGKIEKKERLPKPERKAQVVAYIPTPFEDKEMEKALQKFSKVQQDDPSEIEVEENFNRDEYLANLIASLGG